MWGVGETGAKVGREVVEMKTTRAAHQGRTARFCARRIRAAVQLWQALDISPNGDCAPRHA